MNLLSAKVTNFGSYKHLEFDFNDKGLLLIQGATGSGKSTLLDIAPWVLYGVTAKKGAMDNVRSWFSDNEPTTGILTLIKGNDTYVITRVRGSGAQNDLHWCINGSSEKVRGKDLKDSQVMLEGLLGISAELFLTASYFNESNRALTFFTDKISTRREFLQSILDIRIITQLVESSKEKKKQSENEALKTESKLNNLNGQLSAYESQLVSLQNRIIRFDKEKELKLKELQDKHSNFEQTKKQHLASITDKLEAFDLDRNDEINTMKAEIDEIARHLGTLNTLCEACGSPNKEARILEKKKFDLEMSINLKNSKINPYINLLKQEQEKQNNFDELIQQELNRKNVFIEEYDNTVVSKDNLSSLKNLNIEDLNKLKSYVNNITQLQTILLKARGRLFNLNIKQIQQDTNKFLDTYFDSILRMSLFIEKDDSIEVVIHKDSHECDYTQLSKGQKGILKLCFATSVMLMAANNAGIHFDLLMFDESLDGLDAEMKTKAYALFQHIASTRSSTLVIDHSLELKSIFTEALTVINSGGYSTIS